MPSKTGFDDDTYLKEQTEAILKRVERFDHKLYLEFGGKLLWDFHAARVLPGFDPNAKIRLLQQLRGPHDPHSDAGDDAGLRKLGVILTTDTDFSTRGLFAK